MIGSVYLTVGSAGFHDCSMEQRLVIKRARHFLMSFISLLGIMGNVVGDRLGLVSFVFGCYV